MVKFDVNILFKLTFNKTNLEKMRGESFIPFARSLFEPVRSLQKVTHFVLFTGFFISKWLNHINFFSENAIEDGGFKGISLLKQHAKSTTKFSTRSH